MAVFFKNTPKAATLSLYLPALMKALALQQVVDPNVQATQAQRLLDEITPATPATIAWGRVIIALLLLVILFGGSIVLETYPEYTRASETLLHCFELLFTATIGLLGIEAVKHG